MNTKAFIHAYEERRNGANHFVRHPLVRKFQYSDGVQECFETGLYWLGDLLATELPALMKVGDLAIVFVVAEGGKADLAAELSDGVVSWRKHIDYTDLPDGRWIFYINHEGERYAMILPTEH